MGQTDIRTDRQQTVALRLPTGSSQRNEPVVCRAMYDVTAVRRELPAIPLTTTTTTTTSSEQPQREQRSFQTRSSTLFDDDGHYTDIHFNVVGGGGAARIPTWRQSFVDDPGHYNYLEFPTVEQRHRSSRPGGYEGLDPASVHQAPAPSHYTGIGGSRSDRHGYLEPVEVQLDGGNNSDITELRRQQPGPRGLSATRSEEDRVPSQQEANRQGYEGLDPVAVEQLRRTPRPHSYAGIGTDRSAIHSYLEVIGYSGTDGGQNEVTMPAATVKSYEGLDPAVVEELRARTQRSRSYSVIETSSPSDRCSGVGHSGTDSDGDGGTTPKGYEGLDPAEVEELRRRATRPHDYAGLAADDRGTGQGEVAVHAGPGYEGLDPVEVEEFRRRARQPQEYAGLRDNVDDLYSRPVKK